MPSQLLLSAHSAWGPPSISGRVLAVILRLLCEGFAGNSMEPLSDWFYITNPNGPLCVNK